MTRYQIITRFILAWEGGYANDPADSGGPTKHGITLKTWQAYGRDIDGDGKITINDLRQITIDDATQILYRHFWLKVNAPYFQSQTIANILTDWIWLSGPANIKTLQRLIKVKPDGIIGHITTEAINQADPIQLLAQIKQIRSRQFQQIITENPKKKKFLKGWTNRLNSIQPGRLILPSGEPIIHPI